MGSSVLLYTIMVFMLTIFSAIININLCMIRPTNLWSVSYKWAATWQYQQSGVCAQRSLRSAWASAQSDQSLRCPHEESLSHKLPIEQTAKTLIRLGGCPGWSESPLGAHSFCWFCHVVAQMDQILKIFNSCCTVRLDNESLSNDFLCPMRPNKAKLLPKGSRSKMKPDNRVFLNLNWV